MTKKGYLDIAALIVFLIAVGGFIFLIAASGFIYWQLASVEQLKQQIEQEAKLLEETHKPQPPSEANKPPRKARAGFKWAWHGDHWHEMPIDAPDTWQGEPSVAAHDTQPLSEGVGTGAKVEYPNPDKPVQALREYARKRGHWSAEYIPDFPPEDAEAAELAQNILIMLAHRDAGNEFYDGPAEPAAREYGETLEHYKFSMDQRSFDLYKLSWFFLEVPLGSDAISMFFGE